MNPLETRKPEYPANEIFLKRWSPRAMSGEPMTKEELFSLFEAAKWAPSSYNEQPWRFIYALKGDEHWNNLFNLLLEFNQSWCKNGAALVVILSSKQFKRNNKGNRVHSFDAGSAWQNFALQGSLNGLVVHGMGGFDYDKAKEVLNVPDNYQVEAMAVVGKPGKKEDLPQMLQSKEIISQRNSIDTFTMHGSFRQE